MTGTSCVFCAIIRGELNGSFVYRDDSYIILMDKYPVNTGHTLLIPKKHYHTLLEMPGEEVARLYSKLPSLAKAVVSAVGADGFNVGQNNGLAANQIIPHVHVHVIPRFADDSPNGRWPIRRVATSEELEKTAEKIRSFLKPALLP